MSARSPSVSTSILRLSMMPGAPTSREQTPHLEAEAEIRHCQDHYLNHDSHHTSMFSFFKRLAGVRSADKAPHGEPIFTEHEHRSLEAGVALRPINAPSGQKEKEDQDMIPELEREKQVFLKSLNSARRVDGAGPVARDMALEAGNQAYADTLPNAKPYHGDWTVGKHAPSQILEISEPARLGQEAIEGARIIGPPGYGSLACCEHWYGGKYRRHTDRVHVKGAEHPANCPCRLTKAWEAMVDPRWNYVAFARTKDWRWVAEFRVSDGGIMSDWAYTRRVASPFMDEGDDMDLTDLAKSVARKHNADESGAQDNEHIDRFRGPRYLPKPRFSAPDLADDYKQLLIRSRLGQALPQLPVLKDEDTIEVVKDR
jgi:hypothetical protein